MGPYGPQPGSGPVDPPGVHSEGLDRAPTKVFAIPGPGRVGAQSGLGPGPGWGPYGPLCFFEKGYVSGSDGSV